MMKRHQPHHLLLAVAVLLPGALAACAQVSSPSDTPSPEGPLVPDLSAWDVHDMNRPRPPVIDPGTHQGLQESPAPAPSDAIVLFDGSDLSAWQSDVGGPAPWKVENGYMEVVPGAKGIRTVQGFGDVQLHVEFATPSVVEGTSQGRGNSGVFLMREYEVQVLDSYDNDTYPDGQAASIYGQYPPLVNASRAPGVWQTYDIVFTRPRFNDDGSLQSPARVTVLHNGVLVQNNVTLTGPTENKARPPYSVHSDREPISLQDHDNPMRFRNIWVRELE